MWVQIRLLGPSLLPDESPDNAVEAEIDYEAGIWKTKQGGLCVMNPGRLLINLIDMDVDPLVCHQVNMYCLPSPLSPLGM